jgi:uncharacterized protein (DUF2267 family)
LRRFTGARTKQEVETVETREFVNEVASRLAADERRAEGVTFAVFRLLRDRLPEKESSDLAAQLPTELKRLWREDDRRGRPVEKLHASDFIGRVRRWAGRPDDIEARRGVCAVFATLQHALGSPTGREGEAWDVLSVLPKDLKHLWLEAAEHRPA